LADAQISLTPAPVVRTLVPVYGPHWAFVVRVVRPFFVLFFGSGPSADPSHVISSSLGLLVSMDALRLGFFVSDHF